MVLLAVIVAAWVLVTLEGWTLERPGPPVPAPDRSLGWVLREARERQALAAQLAAVPVTVAAPAPARSAPAEPVASTVTQGQDPLTWRVAFRFSAGLTMLALVAASWLLLPFVTGPRVRTLNVVAATWEVARFSAAIGIMGGEVTATAPAVPVGVRCRGPPAAAWSRLPKLGSREVASTPGGSPTPEPIPPTRSTSRRAPTRDVASPRPLVTSPQVGPVPVLQEVPETQPDRGMHVQLVEVLRREPADLHGLR